MFRTRRRGEGGIVDLSRTRHAGPAGSRSNRRRNRPELELLEARHPLSTLFVSNTDDSGAGSLRQAILDANAHAGSDDIEFRIPA